MSEPSLPLHATIRLYPGMAGHAGRFAVRRLELETLMRTVPGLVSFHLLETAEGVAAVLLCRDRASCDEASRLITRWTDERFPDLAPLEPLVVTGGVIAQALERQVPSEAAPRARSNGN